MRAVQFVVSIPRYAFTLAAGQLSPSAFYGPLSCVQYRDVPEPRLPGPGWVKVKVRYGGICASDVGLVHLADSPSLSPFGAERFTIGHENVGTLAEVGEAVDGFAPGDRVVVDPVLPCAARGLTPPCRACQAGEFPRCENTTRGELAGFQLGNCAQTGGSWSPHFVAHCSQVFRVPEGVSDENALMVDLFSSALHPVIRHLPGEEDTALILGAGALGLCLVAAIRALGSRARLIVLAKYPFQADLARRYGADEVVRWDRKRSYYTSIAELVGGQLLQPVLGPPIVVGGADVTFEGVGSDASVRDALWLTRAGGTVVQAGLIGLTKKVDWSPLWFKELTMAGTLCSSTEDYQGQRVRCYQMALDLIAQGKVDLAPLLTHTYRLHDYRRALAANTKKGRHQMVHSAFAFD